MPPSSEPPPAWGGWLHALWGQRAVVAAMPPAADGAALPRPVLTGREGQARVLHLPPGSGHAWGLAAAAHAAAHWRHGAPPQPRAGLHPLQQALHGVLEDARVEALALRELPGLRALWAPFHAGTGAGAAADAASLLARLDRALLLPEPADPHPWVARVRAELGGLDGGLARATPTQLRGLASRLGHALGQTRLPFEPRGWHPHAAYRDDGSWLWEPDAERPPHPVPLGADAGEGGAADQDASAPADTLLASYPEWDARIGRYRPGWCQVHAGQALSPRPHRLPPLDAAGAAALAALHAALPTHAPRPAGRAAAGDDLDGMAAIDARLALQDRQPPDPRVWVARVAPPRPLAVQLLVDASASTAAPAGDGCRLLERLLALALAASARLQAAGHDTAVSSFASWTRARVVVRPVQHWHEPAAAAAVRERAARQPAAGSTRSGAALRHGTAQACARAARRGRQPVVLLLSDGRPHDVDAPAPGYLRGDLHRALREARQAGAVARVLTLPGIREGAVP